MTIRSVDYKRAYQAAMEVFRLSCSKDERHSLTDQIVRSSRSVAANIREGFAKRDMYFCGILLIPSVRQRRHKHGLTSRKIVATWIQGNISKE